VPMAPCVLITTMMAGNGRRAPQFGGRPSLQFITLSSSYPQGLSSVASRPYSRRLVKDASVHLAYENGVPHADRGGRAGIRTVRLRIESDST